MGYRVGKLHEATGTWTADATPRYFKEINGVNSFATGFPTATELIKSEDLGSISTLSVWCSAEVLTGQAAATWSIRSWDAWMGAKIADVGELFSQVFNSGSGTRPPYFITGAGANQANNFTPNSQLWLQNAQLPAAGEREFMFMVASSIHTSSIRGCPLVGLTCTADAAASTTATIRFRMRYIYGE